MSAGPPNRKSRSRWITQLGQARAPRARLLCFPYAGGGSAAYRPWPVDLTAAVELWAALLPGRETRISDPPIDHLPTLLSSLAEAVNQLTDLPLIFFGHSMGALVAFELARLQQRRGLPIPRLLLVSGHTAPQLPRTQRLRGDLSDASLRRSLAELGATPREVLENDELMELLLPAIRSDFRIFQQYHYVPGEPLGCPIAAFGGDKDHAVPRAALEAWAQQAAPAKQGDCSSTLLPGDHFYLLGPSRPALVRAVSKTIAGLAL